MIPNKKSSSAKSIEKSCVICAKENSAYRCPKCRQHYCSKDCCAAHKSQQCGATSSVNTAGERIIQLPTTTTTTEIEIDIRKEVETSTRIPADPVSIEVLKELSSTCTGTTDDKIVTVESVVPLIDSVINTKSPQIDDSLKTTDESGVGVDIDGNNYSSHEAAGKVEEEEEEESLVIDSEEKNAINAEQILLESDVEFEKRLQQQFYILSEVQKQRLLSHPVLSGLLRNQRLQQDLRKVNDAADRVEALRGMRRLKPDFNQIAEMMYDIVMEKEESAVLKRPRVNP